MTPSWLNNYLGQQSPYGVSQMNTTPDWMQQAIPSQAPTPYGASMADMSQVNSSGGAMMAGRLPMMMSSQMLAAGQPKAAPMMQNNIPMGRNMSYQDIMKMYGIQGLMG
jgi:hypothetical protein